MNNITDLTQRPPRSMRTRLGGYALLPRMLDKGRAEIAGKNGEYHYNCPLDQRILEYLGVDAEALRKELAAGKGDGEILEWIRSNQKNKHTDAEIEAWSDAAGKRVPEGESIEFFNEIRTATAPHRSDITTWADLLDVDDYVTFGGKA
ncbi:hypothetical protein CfE428DRAFT_1718 [Chthoniobacter flavus Ellin428]|uniref:DUF5069 domain-containing protein n=1 Tax=Chthoniobacter flavus Ellin428 TaxID=497964 RepID=B4CYI0_9BACT|nr:DUF5069 domain-containing protein [Chthoniobacter flavus]EDY20521.1 hypothetical protein CfE428DRAFT_1718 [Chthoniobacter flavus Ellin428]TCO89964.1 uncharacterized protein DUF5069 [Chthoniobacter flavus]